MSRQHRVPTRQARRRARRAERRGHRLPVLHKCLGVASFAALGLSALCVMFVISGLSPTVSTAMASGTGNGLGAPTAPAGTIHPTCNLPGLPACAPTEGWIPLRSTLSADIIVAAKRSTLFHVDRSSNGDYLKDISRLGVPQLVQALHVAGKANSPDYFIIPIENATGQTVGSAEWS